MNSPFGVKLKKNKVNGTRCIIRQRMLAALWFIVIALLVPFSAHALSSPTVDDEALSIRLITDKDAVGTSNEILLGLDIELKEGWHTYWRSPGIAGAPPTLDWSKSDNLQDPVLLYPAPKRITLMDMDTIGYEGRVILPIRAKIQDTSKPLTLSLSLDILVCKELCQPKHFDLNLNIPVGEEITCAEAELLHDAVAKVPTTKSQDISVDRVTRESNTISVSIRGENLAQSLDMFIEAKEDILFTKPIVQIGKDKKTATLTAKVDGSLPKDKALKDIALTLTITNGSGSSIEHTPAENTQTAQQTTPPTTNPENGKPLPLWCILLFALAGGFILNLMPCVLPVLSLKVFAVVKHGGGEHRRIRHSFLSTGAGIIVSFLVLALVTIALKAGGQVIGWGVQFQQPTFLVFMITLLTLFAANLWGFFEITLPRFVMDSLDPSHHPKLAGDFATGIVATLLATPCSAPFLGTAIGFAMAAGWIEIVLVFLMLGVGMTIPYFAIAIWPQLASKLPKPGAWEITLTRILGFGMAATAIWLLFVLSAQIGQQMTIAIVLCMVIVLAQLYLRHKNILRALTIPLVTLLFLGAMGTAYVATTPEAIAPTSGVWEKFDEDAIHRHVREGKTVFVDITADWCITCKANKRFTIASEQVSEKLFNSSNVVAMQGDWTNPDPVLTAYLQKQGRYGIPFNAVFGPAAPDGILLPELLTPSLVLKALEEAKGPPTTCPVNLPKGKDC